MSPKLDFKASDLLKEVETLAKLRKKNYRVQLQKCLTVVNSAHKDLHQQYTVYNIPMVLPGDPNFALQECISYLKEKLMEAEFYVKLMQPGNVLLISWLPEHVRKVKKKLEQQRDAKRAADESREVLSGKTVNKNDNDDRDERKKKEMEDLPVPHIIYQPTSALSNLSLRSSLMRDNPKYDHLKSMQRLKRRGKGGGSRARR